MSVSTPTERLEPVLTWIGEQRDAAIADLQRFCRQPSISAQGQGMQEMAQLVAESLRALGTETALVPIRTTGRACMSPMSISGWMTFC